MAWSHDVVRLQEVDLERIKIHARCTEINTALQDDKGVLVAKQALRQAQSKIETIRKEQETLEFELGKVQSKSRLTQEKLYSGRITNSRELQDLQAEGESLKRRNAELEDEILEVMMQREEAEDAASQVQAMLKKLQALSSNHHTVLNEELTSLQLQDKQLTVERETLVASLPETIVDTYTYLRSRTANRPVAVLRDRQCGVCGMDVSPSNVQKARHSEEAYCGGCRRLIVNLD